MTSNTVVQLLYPRILWLGSRIKPNIYRECPNGCIDAGKTFTAPLSQHPNQCEWEFIWHPSELLFLNHNAPDYCHPLYFKLYCCKSTLWLRLQNKVCIKKNVSYGIHDFSILSNILTVLWKLYGLLSEVAATRCVVPYISLLFWWLCSYYYE